jgi:protein-tyrosine phosphatase
MGNICRSPTAEGVFRHHVAEAGFADLVLVDSAGTHAYHVGEPPDRRAVAAAERRGYSMDKLRARRVVTDDFSRFDYVLGMDRDNVALLKAQAEEEHHGKIRLLLECSSARDDEVPDPYYGGAAGFERVLDLVEEASAGLLARIRQEHFRES